MMSLNTGAPHFRSIAKQHRHANYTLEKVINEAVDNIIKKATEIHLTTDVDSDGRLQELKISDNYVSGFESINQEGVSNPFNMGHIKTGHDVDDETSEFGVGLKAGALSAANELLIVSNVGGAYYQVLCDFLKMEKEEDVNASYNPKIKTITEADYKQLHPFPNGSSIIMSKIRDTICDRTTQRELTDRLKKGISETYSRFLTQNMRIFVNGELVAKEVDFFSDPKCVHFTVKKKLYVLEKGADKIFVMSKTIENPVWQIYDKEKSKWESMKQQGLEFMTEKMKEGYKYAYSTGSVFSDGSCMEIDSIFTFYSDLFHTKNKDTESEIMPSDMVQIYKDNRKYGKKSFKKHNNGCHNYTLHRVDFSSKKIGKELGITFNKDITMEGTNDLILAIKAAVDDSRSAFNADTSTGANEKLCEKAVKRQVLDWTKCNIEKLSTAHKELRKKHEADEKKKEELRKKKEEDDLRKQIEADILRKKLESEELKRVENEKLRLEAEKLRLEKLTKETPEERSARLAAEKEQELKAEKERLKTEKERLKAEKEKQRAEQERLNAEQERLKAEQERDAATARERLEQEKIAAEKEKERKQKAEQEEQRQLAIRQEEARQRLRETIAYIKSITEDKLEDTEGILSNVRHLLQI